LPDGFFFPTKNPNLGIFWRALEWKKLLYSLAISNILVPLGTFYGHFVIMQSFGTLFSALVNCGWKKSGNPGLDCGGKYRRRKISILSDENLARSVRLFRPEKRYFKKISMTWQFF
jgi:hypothetical protein